jgi:hypothetical protein
MPAMKFDKDTLIRQRFWVGLGVFVLLWTILILTTWSRGPSAVKEVKEPADKATTAMKGLSPKNENYWAPLDKTKAFYDSQIGGVWMTAWLSQKPWITWPESTQKDKFDPAIIWEKAQNFEEWKKLFEDPEIYVRITGRFPELYRDEFYDEKTPAKSFFKQVEPVEFKGGLDGYKAMMAPTAGNASASLGAVGPGRPGLGAPGANIPGAGQAGGRTIDNCFPKKPSCAECWYAQEDYWIKREMMNAVKRTLEATGKCVHEDRGFWTGAAYRIQHPGMEFSTATDAVPRPETGTTIKARHRFRNASWELDLLFVEANGKLQISNNSTIRNVHVSKRIQALSTPPAQKGRQRGPITFMVRQYPEGERSNPREFKLDISGADQAADQFTPIGSAMEGKARSIEVAFDPNLPFEVEQVFDWSACPVRRIDDIRTCYNAHRTADRPLKPHRTLYKPDDTAATTGQPGGLGPQPAPAPMGDQPGAAAAAAMAPPSDPNGLEQNRYYNVTDPDRDLPFAMVVVLEQPHMNDFLVQIANSDLRIQITQVQFRRVRDVAPPPPADISDPTMPPRLGGPGDVRGPGPGPGVHQPGGLTSGEGDPNLVEVTVYGIAAMYEKCAKPDTAKKDGQTKP